MLKKSASGVLASLKGSTYRSVRLASSLAAALLDSLFEHPEGILALAPNRPSGHIFGINRVFSSLLGVLLFVLVFATHSRNIVALHFDLGIIGNLQCHRLFPHIGDSAPDS